MASLEERAINTIRFLAIDAVQKANSGHPGLPMGAAPMAYVLWTKFLKHNPQNPHWFDRDRFILSAGHGSMLLYALLHLTGYDVTMYDIQNFRQWDSRTAGHPEYGFTPGVEITTGPLGQGAANAIGIAMAEAFLAARYNRPGHTIVDHYTYALVSDGDLMEGVSAEAGSLAGHLKLGKLIYLYDDNKVSLAAMTDVTFTENVGKRYEAYGWHVQYVINGNDLEALEQAIEAAKAVTDQPSIILIRTVLGYGSPKKAGTPDAHGSPLGKDEVRATKENLGWPLEPEFLIEEDVLNFWRSAVQQGAQAEQDWALRFAAYQEAYPELAAELSAALNGELPAGWDSAIKVYEPSAKGLATRASGGEVLNAIASQIPTFIGGDADLSTSTRTTIKGSPMFAFGSYEGRNIPYGVREHAMGSINNGLAIHGGITKPFTATFFAFSDYMRPPIRLAALMSLENIFIFTHDSIGLGEDGPTHQPVEQLAAMRAIPSVVVLRPADANEVAVAWKVAMTHKGGPVVMVLSRQDTPTLDYPAIFEGVPRGGYVISEAADNDPQAIIMGTGTELALALKAQEQLASEGIRARVVSIPSFELFEAQGKEYIQSVLPPHVTNRVAVEAALAQGWHPYLKDGVFIGVGNRFGASAPAERIYQEFGITAEAIVTAVKSQL